MTARLVLGTAQFGLDYGIVNRNGKLSEAQSAELLAVAREAKVDLIDTAAAYGDAEDVLGRADLGGFQIVTKIPLLRNAANSQAVLEHCRRSLIRLGLSRVHAVLLHSASDLMGGDADAVYAGLMTVKDAGLAERIGVSLYESAEAQCVTSRFPLDLVQCPFSVLDNRMAASIRELSDRGTAVHVRSVFLQGLALQSLEKIPARLTELAPYVSRFHAQASEQGLSPVEAALAYARDWPGVEGVVVGVSSIDEFRTVVGAFEREGGFDAHPPSEPAAQLLDPRQWG